MSKCTERRAQKQENGGKRLPPARSRRCANTPANSTGPGKTGPAMQNTVMDARTYGAVVNDLVAATP